MESIIDTMLERDIVVYTDDPYSLVFRLINSLSALGDYDEKKNVYETDGPVKKIHVIFSIVEKLGRSSKIDIKFSLEGHMGTSSFLEMKVEGSLITRFEQPTTAFTETYLAYYLSNVSQEFKKMAMEKMKETDTIIADTIKDIKHVYL